MVESLELVLGDPQRSQVDTEAPRRGFRQCHGALVDGLASLVMGDLEETLGRLFEPPAAAAADAADAEAEAGVGAADAQEEGGPLPVATADGDDCANSQAVLTLSPKLVRVLICPARALNAAGRSRVTLSLRREHLRAGCEPWQGGKEA